MDAITIGMYYGVPGSTPFSTFMAIVNLLLRPVSSLFLVRFYNDRLGSFSSSGFPGLPGFSGSGFADRRSAYEDLERPSRVATSSTQQSLPSHIVSSSSPDVDLLTK